jgi:hypothetical protein
MAKVDVSVSGDGSSGGVTIYCSVGDKTVSVSCGFESYGSPHGPDMLIVQRSSFGTWDDGTAIDTETRRQIFAAVDAAPIPVMYRWG